MIAGATMGARAGREFAIAPGTVARRVIPIEPAAFGAPVSARLPATEVTADSTRPPRIKGSRPGLARPRHSAARIALPTSDAALLVTPAVILRIAHAIVENVAARVEFERAAVVQPLDEQGAAAAHAGLRGRE